jgi:hypothetical protein
VIAVGDVLTREDGSRVRLVGVSEGEWVAEPADTFGAPVRLSARDLTACGVDDAAAPAEADPYRDTSGWEALARASEATNERVRRGDVDPGELAEDVFARANAEAAEVERKTAPRRKRGGIDGADAKRLGHRG